eukprot:Skav213190  [mRNA]  locus=scaffold2826:84137:88068:+ [translate_table: standard]
MSDRKMVSELQQLWKAELLEVACGESIEMPSGVVQAAIDVPLPYFDSLAEQLEMRAEQVYERVTAVEKALATYNRQVSGVPVAAQIEAVVRSEFLQFKAIAAELAQAGERIEQLRDAAVRTRGVPVGMLARPAEDESQRLAAAVRNNLTGGGTLLGPLAMSTINPALMGCGGCGMLGPGANPAGMMGASGSGLFGGNTGGVMGGGLFGGNTSGGLFGANTGGGLFGGNTGGGMFGANTGGGLFGGNTGGGMFGANTGGGLFGGNTGGGMFGANTGGLFGGNTGGGMFGANTGGGLFGGNTGGGMFGANTGGGLFGGNTGGGMFGANTGGGLF